MSWLAFVVTFEGYRIPSHAMTPTLRAGDRVFVQARGWSPVRRGDIVVFRLPVSTSSDDFDRISRVVAVAGDTVASRDDRLVVNGKVATEPYLAARTKTLLPRTVKVPAGHVFVLADNRANSTDSRAFGPVQVSRLKGVAKFRYWPPSRLGGP